MANSSTRKPTQDEIEEFFKGEPASAVSATPHTTGYPSYCDCPISKGRLLDIRKAQLYLNRFLEREDKR